MGAYCRIPGPRHDAREGETLKVQWSAYYGAVLFGDRGEIACIPHRGCRLELVAAAATSHDEVDRLLPGQVLRYRRSFFLPDRLVLPSGRNVGLWHFVGFMLRLAPDPSVAPGREELVVQRLGERELTPSRPSRRDRESRITDHPVINHRA